MESDTTFAGLNGLHLHAAARNAGRQAPPQGLRQQTAFDNRAELRRTHVAGVETQRSPRVMFPDLPGLIWRATRRGNLAPHAERKSTRLHSSHYCAPRMPPSA